MKHIKTLTLAMALVLILSGSALAVTWDWTNLGLGPNPLGTTYYYNDGTDGVLLAGARYGNPENLSWYQDDGFGVWGSPENDEVASPEYLVLIFDGPVYLQEVYLTDLFYEGGYFEQGSFGFGEIGGTSFSFAQDELKTQANSNGEYTLSMADFGLAETLIEAIWFTAPGLTISGQNHEFSIGGLSFDAPSVPVPGAVWLLGSGLIGLVGLRRTFQS